MLLGLSVPTNLHFNGFYEYKLEFEGVRLLLEHSYIFMEKIILTILNQHPHGLLSISPVKSQQFSKSELIT